MTPPPLRGGFARLADLRHSKKFCNGILGRTRGEGMFEGEGAAGPLRPFEAVLLAKELMQSCG